MKPKRQDVEQMVAALFTTMQSMESASRKGDASRLKALFTIALNPEITPKALSEILGLHPSSVTRQIQALEKEGNVKVAADPEDGRSCRVRLSPAGLEEIRRLQEIGMNRFASFVASWDAGEVRELARLLTKLEQSKAEVNATASKPAGASWRTGAKANKKPGK
jgi:DNA-binding MarR family transcriptional regulator